MSLFTEKDREYLARACSLVEAARRPPTKLGLAPEPYWGAVLATPERELSAAIFRPGDNEDAVKTLLTLPESVPADATLYLTLEPRAGFERIPPTTESVRRLGVRRVVLGALDPAQRLRGEGRQTLERLGVEVVLADGEEARRAQTLLEDYAKWLQKGLAVLRARMELKTAADREELDLAFSTEVPPLPADAVLTSAGRRPATNGAWLVIVDPECWERPAERTIVYQPSDRAVVPGVRTLSFLDGRPNLGALLRDLAQLGILSVDLGDDPELFRLALSSGLLDSVSAHLPDTVPTLSRIGTVRMRHDSQDLHLRLDGARLLDGQSRCLEARVELC
jgi:pyrimidine deaminase RibD-like protein